MRQFDVYRNPSSRSGHDIPYLVVLQSHYFDRVPTVIVAPLLVDDARSAYSEASVKVAFLGNPYVASIPELAGIDASSLRKSLGDLRDYEYELRRALDLLFTGF